MVWFYRCSYLCGPECGCWTGGSGRRNQVLWDSPLGCPGTEEASPSLGPTHPGSPRLKLERRRRMKQRQRGKGWGHAWLCVQATHNEITAASLTHVIGDDGEGFQVGFPDVLCQRVGIVLEIAEQVRRAALCPLDLLPVLLSVRIQNGTARSYQVLKYPKLIDLMGYYCKLLSMFIT